MFTTREDVWTVCVVSFFFFQAEDGIRDLVRSRGLGDVYKRQRDDWDKVSISASLTKPVRQRDLYECLDVLLRGTGALRALKNDSADESPVINAAQPHRVLLVEDNAVNLAVAQSMLDKINCHVMSAGNGREALELIAANEFDLVLMDCQMPEMDGLTATRLVREREAATTGLHLPIVALTANALQGDREKCLDAGMDEYLTQPFSTAQLRVAVEKWSRLAQSEDVPMTLIRSTNNMTGAVTPVDVLDRAALDQIRQLQGTDQPDLLRQVIEIYLDSSAQLVRQIDTALAAADPSAAGRVRAAWFLPPSRTGWSCSPSRCSWWRRSGASTCPRSSGTSPWACCSGRMS